jgi:site-specific DNA-methyltransferase (adenine-specific)
MSNQVHLCDCMEFMKGIPDKYYELAIVDPPYGIGAGKMTMGKGRNKNWGSARDWDRSIPSDRYFEELFRISAKQIIWGGNYFELPLTGGWIFWDKERGKDVSFADGELAWTSFLSVLKKAPIRYDGFIGADISRIHPTQKPVALYKWLLKNYAKPGDKIFDSHVGSGSIRIACHDMGFDFEGCEIDKDYWEAQEERYQMHAMQQDLFSREELQEITYSDGVLI